MNAFVFVVRRDDVREWLKDDCQCISANLEAFRTSIRRPNDDMTISETTMAQASSSITSWLDEKETLVSSMEQSTSAQAADVVPNLERLQVIVLILFS